MDWMDGPNQLEYLGLEILQICKKVIVIYFDFVIQHEDYKDGILCHNQGVVIVSTPRYSICQ